MTLHSASVPQQQLDAGARIAALEEQVAQQIGINFALSCRVAELERRLGVETVTPQVTPWLLVKQAAPLVHLTEGRVYQLARAGKIKSQRYAGHLFVDPDSLANYKVTARV